MTDKKMPSAMEQRTDDDDGRQFSPSVARNGEPIRSVLVKILTPGMKVLEIASGTGEHGVAMVAQMDGLIWQPSDVDAAARHSIAAWRRHLGNANLLTPLELDAQKQDWAEIAPGSYGALICINMIHIAPWAAALGVLRGAGHALELNGRLFFYGPFKRHGHHTADSNLAFDLQLQATNPEWGVRDADEIVRIATEFGLSLDEITELPNNNCALVLRKIVAS